MLKSKETNLLPCTFGNKLYKDLLRNRKYDAWWRGGGGGEIWKEVFAKEKGFVFIT